MGRILKSKKGEGYVDVCITAFIYISLAVVALNLFSFVTLKSEMDQIADELIIMATHTGEFGDAFAERDEELLEQYFNYDIDYGANEYFKNAKVQLGNSMWVKISVDTHIKGMGIFKIPVTLSVKRSGISEVYWK